MKKRDNIKSALPKWAIEFNADRVWLMDDALRTLQLGHILYLKIAVREERA
jgi:hypothetical protein